MHSLHRRRPRIRAAVALATAAVVAATLAACAPGSGGTAPADADIPAEGIDDGSTLTLWTRAPLQAQAELLVDAYNASHENQVELTIVANDDYVAKVGAAAGSGQLPDLFAADIAYVPNFVSQGMYQDIAPLIDQLDYKDEINQAHIAAGTYEGDPYVVPFVMDLSMMLWNKELFAEAGLDPEVAPATLQEFADAAKAIQALGKPGVSGTAAGLNCGGCLMFTWMPMVWASGSEVMNAEGTESLLDNEASQEVFAIWKDLYDSGALAEGSADETGATWVAGFQEGKVGIMPYPATLLPSLEFDAGLAGIPGIDGGASTFVGGDGIGISKDSKLTGQAWNFLSWLLSEDTQVEVLAKGGNAVSRSDLADNEYAAADPRLVTVNEVAAEGQLPIAINSQQAFNSPGSPWLTLVRNAVLGDGTTIVEDNAEITAVLDQ
ncbi:sugar ABC transporter substrate-binding protein [Herbiconiux moechotypicola]|uniref:Sugar ABC transporter substrate-binding protein n=1 Tax=Herbiconiux moechotypicola TaxID=637393 RepID=A0ABN3DX30_9MICO|nr:sugar ABC transporter substrate-binding protein [Herbiconiux moechotypicola]MCS5730788.1 sugar ABC transporter substrate-binding protein [Herbiconiux moechotypicola]